MCTVSERGGLNRRAASVRPIPAERLLACLLVAGALGCGRFRAPADAEGVPAGPRIEDLSWGPIRMTLEADPPRVALNRDLLLTFRIAAPADVGVTLPPLNDRLEGFALSGAFHEEPVARDGKTAQVHHLRLTPLLASRYRLAPVAVAYVDRATGTEQSDWFLTRPVVFELDPPFPGDPGDRIAADLKPVWIPPAFSSVLGYTLLALALAGGAWGAWKLLTRVRRNIELRRLSPRERALRELAGLLARDLVARSLIKEFYLELTMIVRRYIERRHGIRAPEQTTEEFLTAVASDPRFGVDVMRRLKAFLQAADLVKFAAYHPAPDAITRATDTARDYLETDETPQNAAAAPQSGATDART
jgi:hypothetical protein